MRRSVDCKVCRLPEVNNEKVGWDGLMLVDGCTCYIHTYVGAVMIESEEDDLVDTCSLQKAFMF